MNESASSVETLLVEARKKLDAAIEELILQPGRPQAAALGEIAALLEHAASLQPRARLQSPAGQGRDSLTAASARAAEMRALLRSISARAARCKRLLEAAAMFYQGCISASCSPPSGYTADGQWSACAAPGRLRLEA